MATVNPIELQKYLKGLEYPASRGDIVSKAKEHDAPDEIISALGGIGEDDYETPAAINKAIGQENDDED